MQSQPTTVQVNKKLHCGGSREKEMERMFVDREPMREGGGRRRRWGSVCLHLVCGCVRVYPMCAQRESERKMGDRERERESRGLSFPQWTCHTQYLARSQPPPPNSPPPPILCVGIHSLHVWQHRGKKKRKRETDWLTNWRLFWLLDAPGNFLSMSPANLRPGHPSACSRALSLFHGLI